MTALIAGVGSLFADGAGFRPAVWQRTGGGGLDDIAWAHPQAASRFGAVGSVGRGQLFEAQLVLVVDVWCESDRFTLRNTQVLGENSVKHGHANLLVAARRWKERLVDKRLLKEVVCAGFTVLVAAGELV